MIKTIEMINQEMIESGDMFQIKRVNHKEMVSIEVDKLAQLLIDLAFNSELQDKIMEANMAMDEVELSSDLEEEWFLPSYSKKNRVKEYMRIYNEFCKETNIKDDKEIPF